MDFLWYASLISGVMFVTSLYSLGKFYLFIANNPDTFIHPEAEMELYNEEKRK